MKSVSEIKSLRRIFFLLVITITISLAGVIAYIYADTRNDRINDLGYTASVIKEYYELSFRQWELSLLSVGNRLAEIESIEEKAAFATDALKIYERELLAFGFARPDGQILVFSGRLLTDSLPHLMQSEKTRRSFDLARKGDRISIGECYYTSLAGDWVIPIRVPIRDEKGNLVAVNTTGVDYSGMVEDLKRFGFNENYQIHLINKNFGTTQILYPLAKEKYESILGRDSLSYHLEDGQEERLNEDLLIFSCMNPLNNEASIVISTDITPVNHQLVVSVPKTFISSEVFDRIKFVGGAYIGLVAIFLFLYTYLKGNLEKSIDKLKAERANLKSIIESTSDLIGLFDPNKKLVEFNRAFKISAKLTDDMTLQKGMNILKEIKHKDQVSHFNNLFNKALKGEKFQVEIVYPGPKGDLIFKSTYTPVFNEDRVVGITFFAEDITEIRSYQRQLEELNKDLESKVQERTKELKKKNKELSEGYKKLQSTQQQLIRAEKMASLGILSAGIGHEINNPLNFIKHGALALKENLTENSGLDGTEQYFHAIEEGVKRAAQIVNGLSHFSRSGKTMDETCDIHEILQNSLTLLTNRFRKKNIEINTNFDAENAVINGNEGKLHQVFTNIITNAEQAIPDKGVIIISTKNEKQNICVEIADTGIGMNKKEMEQMSDPFFTTKDPGEGTGLGMFITQMIIDEHDGEIKVKSKKGEGTTFQIILKNK
ncbi:ATP-binding protein [Ekhidna sp.]|uniref:ATP-binding protein n=1 Tax=Ekhidna sp. TaxID=2608089 RepID=UPI003B514C25